MGVSLERHRSGGIGQLADQDVSPAQK